MTGVPECVWLGYDPREADGFMVAQSSLRKHAVLPVPCRGLSLRTLRAQGLYTRSHSIVDGRIWDDTSGAPMATEFALTRFLVPTLQRTGWALFADSDVLFLDNVSRLFKLADPRYAVMVVKHDYRPAEGTKMDGQVQLPYARKNWSSVMLFNCQHPANRQLTPELVNTARGLDLHQFCWLDDSEIGELPESWNWLVGHSTPRTSPSLVHFTTGIPRMLPGERLPYASEWWLELEQCVNAW